MPILRVELNKLSSDWQVTRALLENEYTSLDKSFNKFKTRYDFAVHLLDVHRLWCVRRALAQPACLPLLRSDAGEAANNNTAQGQAKIFVSASTQTDTESQFQSTDAESDLLIKQEIASPLLCDVESCKNDSTVHQRPEYGISTQHIRSNVESHFQSSISCSDLLIKQEAVSDENCDVHIESSITESSSGQRHEGDIPKLQNRSDVLSHFQSTNPCPDLLIKQEVVSHENHDVDMESIITESSSERRHEADSPKHLYEVHFLERTNLCSELNIKPVVLSCENGDVNMKISTSGSPSKQIHEEEISTQRIGSDGETILKNITVPLRPISDNDEHNPKGSSAELCDADGKAVLKNITEPLRPTCDNDEHNPKGSSPELCDAGISSIINVQNPPKSQSRKSFRCKSSSKTVSVTVSGKGNLALYMRNHQGKKPFECNLCSYRCSHKSHLALHMRTHTGEKPYECHCCNYKCSVKSSLKRHMRTHTGEKSFECKYCRYRSSSKVHLRHHMRTHSEEMPYKCNCCSYRCSRKSQLTEHFRTHTGEKPFECNCCSYRCSRKSRLTEHVRTHTGEKPFECNLCSYRCSKQSNLACHMRTHTGEKPYECKYCRYRASDKGNLGRHMKTHTI